MLLQEFIAGLQRRVPEGIPPRVVGDLRLLREMTRSRYRSIVNRHPWSFLHEWREVYVPVPYTTGTITLTQGSAVVAGDLTAWTAALVDYHLLTAAEVLMRVLTVTDADTLTLATPWAQATVVGMAYRLAPLELQTGAKRVIGINSKDGWLRKRSLPFFDRIDPKRTSGGSPWAYATRGEDESGMLVEVYPYPTSGAVLRAVGLKEPSALDVMTDAIVFPNPYVLELGVRVDLYKYAYSETGDQKFAALAAGEESMFQSIVGEMIEEDLVAASWPSSLTEVEPGVSGHGLDYLTKDTMAW